MDCLRDCIGGKNNIGNAPSNQSVQQTGVSRLAQGSNYAPSAAGSHR